MTTPIDLFQFCCNHSLDLQQPMYHIELDAAVATNRHIVVIMPGRPEANRFRHMTPTLYRRLLQSLDALRAHSPYRADLPSSTLDYLPLDPTPVCKSCNGSGLANEGYDWCGACFSTGVEHVPIAVGAAHFQLHYLNLMRAHLPRCKLQLPTNDCLKPGGTHTPFVFEGGYGWLGACNPKAPGAPA